MIVESLKPGISTQVFVLKSSKNSVSIRDVYFLHGKRFEHLASEWDGSGQEIRKDSKAIWERRSDLMGAKVRVGVIENPPKLSLEVRNNSKLF